MDASNPIDELLNTPIPERLWHYTSIRGFRDIVTSKRIFATDTRFLNDREEFIHARRIAFELVEAMQPLGAHSLPVKEFLSKGVEMAFNIGPLAPDRLRVFVACFSAAEDQLSQWRGYSHGSSGASLAFDLRSLRSRTHPYPLGVFAPCV